MERIRGLAVPPAWVNVWICPWPNGHIQAIGTDAAGRRQYLYHDDWRLRRDRQKFDRVLAFARSLPRLRGVVARDLAAEGLGRERVLAAAVRLLDIGCFRIGGEEYAEDHETFGIATLQKKHVRLRGTSMVFDYPAKGSHRGIVEVGDDQAQAVVSALKSRRAGGQDLLAYKQDRRWVSASSEDVNAYIKARAGDDYSAKDFRTWSATVLAAATLAGADRVPPSRAAANAQWCPPSPWWRSSWATRRRCAAPRMSTRGSSTGSSRARPLGPRSGLSAARSISGSAVGAGPSRRQ